jgi:hypothetical protein
LADKINDIRAKFAKMNQACTQYGQNVHDESEPLGVIEEKIVKTKKL